MRGQHLILYFLHTHGPQTFNDLQAMILRHVGKDPEERCPHRPNQRRYRGHYCSYFYAKPSLWYKGHGWVCKGLWEKGDDGRWHITGKGVGQLQVLEAKAGN